MSTSGSVNFTQTRNEIIADTLQLLGVIGGGVTPSTNDINFCSNILNKMVKGWQAQGIQLFTEVEGTLTLTQGVSIVALSRTGTEQSTYPEVTTLGRPLDIQTIRYMTYLGAERRMRKFGRAQFMEIPNKTDQAPATCFFFSPQDTYDLLYIWPTPNNALDTLNISYTREIQDFDTASDNADFPVEWLETITYNLAVRVAPAFGMSLSKVNPDLIQLATSTLAEMRSWDSENGSVFIVPDYRWDSYDF